MLKEKQEDSPAQKSNWNCPYGFNGSEGQAAGK